MPQGFSEASTWAGLVPDTAQSSGPRGPVFPSTGPHGHRSRMRDRMIDRGAAGMADYEILEMLLFLGLPRGDTKPLAKSAINCFGSLARVIDASADNLLAIPGLTPACAVVLDLVRRTSLRQAAADPRHAPVLSDWARLHAYLELAQPAPLRVLYLDSKNRLLADRADQDGPLDAALIRSILRRALELQSVSLLLASARPVSTVTRADRNWLARLREAGATVSVGVHDYVLVNDGEMTSMARTERERA